MTILLVRPPSRHVKGSSKPSASLPLGLLYIAGILEKKGFTVQIYDAQININMPTYCDSDGVMYMGDRWEIVEEEIAKRNPDLVGITNPFTAQFDSAVKTAEIAKRINKNVLTVVGGNHPTVQPEDFFYKTDTVDIACIGEGEFTMLEIAEHYAAKKLWKNIPGTAIRDSGKVLINNPRQYIYELDELPFPAYHLVNLDNYFLLNKKGFNDRPVWRYPGAEKAVSFITSRGCPYDCVFCSVHKHMGKKWRCHSSEYVLRHLEMLVYKYGVKHIHFEDDNLTLDSERFEKILDGLIKRKIGITWDTPNGIRADMITKDLLEKSKESGCTYIILGVESGEQKVLSNIINKQLELTKVIKVAQWCKKIGLDIMAFFVIGFPGETLKDILKTVNFALKLMSKYNMTPSMFIATPLIGTRLYEICKEKGYLRRMPSADNLAVGTEWGEYGAMIQTNEMGPCEIALAMKKFITRFKIIFVKNLLLFIARNINILPMFIGRVWSLKSEIGLKSAVLEMGSLKNCFFKKMNIKIKICNINK